MRESPQILYEFGPYKLDPLRHLLLREGEVVPLTPKVFDILLALVESRGRVLSKEELIRRVWPQTNVEEGNLTQNIFVLRRALGESPNEHRYIITIPGQGYRFVAPVREVRAEEKEAPAIAPHAPGPSASVTSMAVLPFTHLNSNESDEYLGLGIADALITKFSSVKQIVVRPTTAVLKYTDPWPDYLAAGRELGVDTVLEGKIQRAGERIRVTVQLLRVADGTPLWAEKFEENFTDVFSVEDRVSEQVARALMLKLTSEEQRQLAKHYTESTEAFQAYIKGRHFWNKRTAEGLQKAIEYARQAIDLDPTYALAYVGLADSYHLLPGHSGLPPKESFPKAKAAALRALEIDDTLAEAYASLAVVAYKYDWDWAGAERMFCRAIEMKPNYATAHHWYGGFLAFLKRFDESFAELRRAQELDPLSLPINTDLALALAFARRCEQAIEQALTTLEMDRNFTRAHIILGAVYEQRGEYEEAIGALQRARELEAGSNTLALSALGHAYATAGRDEEARRVLDELHALEAQRYVPPYTIAFVHAGLGEHDLAFEWLEKAYENRCVWMMGLGVVPGLDPLRADARFEDLLRRVGLSAG